MFILSTQLKLLLPWSSIAKSNHQFLFPSYLSYQQNLTQMITSFGKTFSTWIPRFCNLMVFLFSHFLFSQSPLWSSLNFGEPQLLVLALLLFVYTHSFGDLFQPNAIIYMLMTIKFMTPNQISTLNS